MLYTMLIYETGADFSRRADPATREAYLAEWPRYAQALRDAGVYVFGSGLQPPDTATTLRFGGGEPQVQDGPFAETKEQLGGLIVLNLPDLDAALDWAARAPRYPGRVIEVRPNVPSPPNSVCAA